MSVRGKTLMSSTLTVSFDGSRRSTTSLFRSEPGELRCIIGPNGAGKDHHDGRDHAGKTSSGFRYGPGWTCTKSPLTIRAGNCAVGIGRKFPEAYCLRTANGVRKSPIGGWRRQIFFEDLVRNAGRPRRQEFMRFSKLLGLGPNTNRWAERLPTGQKPMA